MPPPRFALYTRISKDPTGESTAPARQEKECRQLADDKGIEIVAVYSDVDLSGYRDVVRPEYEAMLAAMAAGEFDGVLVWKLDRLMRRIVEFSRFWGVASKADCALISKSDTIDTTTPIGLAIVYLIVGLAEQESFNTSQRMLSKEREMAAGGKHKTAGRRAYGMRPGWAETNPDEVAVIVEVAGRILDGESISAVVRDLNERDIPSATGGEWSRQALTSLMRSPRLWGWREHLGEVVAPGLWTAVLSEEDGRRLRDVLAPDGVRVPERRRRLLSGMLRCGKCGARMKAGGIGPRMGRRYVCPTKTDGGCNGTTIDLEASEQVIIAMALHQLGTPQIAAKLAARSQRGGEDGAGLLAELAALQERSTDLAKMWAAGELGRQAWLDAGQELERRAEEVSARLAAAQRARPALHLGAGDPDAARAAWDTMSVERRRLVLEQLLDRVIVHGRGSEYFEARLRASLLAEANAAETAGDGELARRRRRQASSRTGGGGSFRPERLEPIWRI